jgi:hypothetical protein
MPMFLLSGPWMCPPPRRSRSRLHRRACARFPPEGPVSWPCAVSPRDRKLISGCKPSVSADTLAITRLMRCPTCTVVRSVPGDWVRRPLTAGHGERPPCPLRPRRWRPSGAVLRELTRPWTPAPRLPRRALATVDGGRSHRQHLSGHRSRCHQAALAGVLTAVQRVLPGCPAHDTQIVMTLSDWFVVKCRS